MVDPVVVESWHVPRALSDEALRLLTSLPMEEIERRLRVPMAADVEVVELPPFPPLMEPPAHLALERYGVTWDGSPDKPLLTRMADGYWTPWHVAADLLERQAAAAPVARLPEDAQVIEPANRTILVPVPAPIPVSERLPEKAEMTDDDEVWVEYPGGEYPLGDTGDYDWEPHKWILSPIAKFTIRENRRWLPAHALPLPEFDHE